MKENKDNKDFEALLADLKEHDGKLTIKPHFYWLFSSGDAVGRKETKYSK